METFDVTRDFIARLRAPEVQSAGHFGRPHYWSPDAAGLVTTADVGGVGIGTGHAIYRSMILPAIEEADHEVILVTCFWARSPTLESLCQSLRKLSAKGVRNRMKIRVRICFSSASLWQKLSHSPFVSGQTYRPSTWPSKLGLPPSEELQGLELKAKSIFLLPSSVMHPKFVIVDRKRVFLPSCNVSWEDWFEGCLELSGPVVGQFVRFWEDFWAECEDRRVLVTASWPGQSTSVALSPSKGLLASQSLSLYDVLAVFLPSPHHRFSLPWLSSENPPPTPLNVYLLTLFERAKRDISIQTPNVTCSAVVSALLAALERGVNVSITTSRRLMRLEQIVTAGTTTERCINAMIARYKQVLRDYRSLASTDGTLEAGLASQAVGALTVRYYESRPSKAGDQEPAQSHLKLTLIDDSVAVFGSGNMDRASWFTSQELGLALTSSEVVNEVQRCLARAIEGRSTVVYPQ